MAALQALSADNLVVLSEGRRRAHWDAVIGAPVTPLVRVSSKCRPPRDDNGGGYCPNSEPSVAPARTLTAAIGDSIGQGIDGAGLCAFQKSSWASYWQLRCGRCSAR